MKLKKRLLRGLRTAYVSGTDMIIIVCVFTISSAGGSSTLVNCDTTILAINSIEAATRITWIAAVVVCEELWLNENIVFGASNLSTDFVGSFYVAVALCAVCAALPHGSNEVLENLKIDLGLFPCYDNIGCFNPKEKMSLKIGGPSSPETIGTTFRLFTKSDQAGVTVSDNTWQTIREKSWNFAKPLVAIVHGYAQSSKNLWVTTLKEALLNNVDCNVLVMDWKNGAKAPNYFRAAKNAPLPGALLSLLLQEMIGSSNRTLTAEQVHVVGLSLGAQVAGFCGRHFKTTAKEALGRITGLDPAGPLFDNSEQCLSKEDAQYVDVIHTNAGKPIGMYLGVSKSIGHVDFYPNGGSEQPGCTGGIRVIVNECSHSRAAELFTESLTNKNCTFISVNCKSGWSGYTSRRCENSANVTSIGEMGYYSIKRKGRGNQFLKTSTKSPYCI